MGALIVFAIAGSGLLFVVWQRTWGHLEGQGSRLSQMPPSSDPDHQFDEAGSATFRGAAWVGRWWRATSPLIRLRLDDSWARVGGSLQLFEGRFGGPLPVWIERSAVVGVHQVRLHFNRGIRFETGDGRYDGVIFWPRDSAAVLDALRDHGWPVSDGDIDEVDARSGPSDAQTT